MKEPSDEEMDRIIKSANSKSSTIFLIIVIIVFLALSVHFLFFF